MWRHWIDQFLSRGENESVTKCLDDIAARIKFLYGYDQASTDFITDLYYDKAMASRRPGFLEGL